MKHTILITGANGQLGTEIRNEVAGEILVPGKYDENLAPDEITDAYGNTYIYTSRHPQEYPRTQLLDITDIDSINSIVKNKGVDVIVNCAAYTNVDMAEGNPEDADLHNHIAVANLAEAAREANATLIQISTDYVYNGEACKPYGEMDETAPISVYGLSKLAGERAVIDSGCSYIILRTSWLYSQYGKTFVGTIRRLTAEKESIKVVVDQAGSPTYAKDLASAVVNNIIGEGRLDNQGIYNYSNDGVCSRYDLAVAVNRLAGHKCVVNPCLSDEFPAVASRPHYSAFNTSLVKKTFGLAIPHWEASLAECLKLF